MYNEKRYIIYVYHGRLSEICLCLKYKTGCEKGRESFLGTFYVAEHRIVVIICVWVYIYYTCRCYE